MKYEDKYLIYDFPKKYGIKMMIKKLIFFVMRLYYNIFIRILKVKSDEEKNYKYDVSICAIFKNEGKYFKEWIEYHRIVGIDHFYLYNNFSDDNYKEILKPYINDGIVTLLDWPKEQAQMECYIDAITKFRKESRWIALIDIDEFIVPNDTDNIYEFLKRFENRPVVLAYWKYFGSSGHINRQKDSLVIEDFTLAWRKYADIGKCFYNSKYEFDGSYKKNMSLHHFMWAKYKEMSFPPVNVFDEICLPNSHHIPKNADKDNFPLQINHYFTKSYEEYVEKKSKGDVYFKVNPHTFEYFYEHDMPCQKSDYHIYKYLIKLKLAYLDCNK